MSDEPGAVADGQNFEDLVWLFRCDSRNRGIIRQGFDEAALLWKAVKATSGNILEVGRNLAGSNCSTRSRRRTTSPHLFDRQQVERRPRVQRLSGASRT